MKAPAFKVAYLGPAGSFAHMVAKQRYPDHSLIPFSSVPQVFDYLRDNTDVKGIVPVENSSGGLIVDTVDGIIENACTLFVEEELSIDVKLALMSKKGREIKRVYSHFAPLHHCDRFLKKEYPNVRPVVCDSTSAAAEAAAKDENGAAIGPLVNAELNGLDVIQYPLLETIPNVTQFFVMGREQHSAAETGKTSIVTALPNHPGSLCDFLKPFADADINLTRLTSRPIIGEPNTYMFLLELKGTEGDPSVKRAIEGARALASRFCIVGSYPVGTRFAPCA